MLMKQLLEDIIIKSGKKSGVSYANKDKRKKFDVDFGKDKLNMINVALGDRTNKRLVLQKIAK
jgi:hypothetical protein